MIPWRVPSAWAAVVAYAGLAASAFLLGPWSEHLGVFLVLHGLAWIACAFASRSCLGLGSVLMGAALFRLFLLPLEPALSDDIFRYVWEGRVQLAGVNPYVSPPAAPGLVLLRDAVWARVNHPEYSAIYPPLAQLVFRLLAAVGGGVTLFKVCFVLFDLAAIALLGAELGRRGRPVAALALYAWNPLVVVEVAASGHLEPFGIALLVVAIVYRQRAPAFAWAALAASIAAKYASLVAVPFFVLAAPAPPRPRALLAAAAVFAAVLAPYATAGWKLFDSLRVYAEHWRYNDIFFRLVQALVAEPRWARIASGGVLLGVLALLARSRGRFENRLMAALAASLLLSPTVHPWYLLWPLALLPLAPSRALFAWSGTIVLAYVYLYPAFGVGPVSRANGVLVLLQMLPVGALALAEVLESRKAA